MEKLLESILAAFKSLGVLARAVRIGPRHMKTMQNHSAYNAAAMLVISFFLIMSINLFSSSNAVGLTTGIISTMMSIVLIGIIGFFVNLADTDSNNFNTPADDGVVAESQANKWSSYIAINFFVLIFVYLLLNGLSAFFWSGSPIAAVLIDRGLSFFAGTLISVTLSSLLATSIVFWLCKRSGKIIDGFRASLIVYVVTNLVCISLFYALHFLIF